jgi:ribose 1,5-bisphosphokinase
MCGGCLHSVVAGSGLRYALPGSCREAAKAGQIVICNLSRALVREAYARLQNVAVVEVTVPEAVLAARLVLRERSEEGISAHG